MALLTVEIVCESYTENVEINNVYTRGKSIYAWKEYIRVERVYNQGVNSVYDHGSLCFDS